MPTPKTQLRALLVHATAQSLAQLQPDGAMPGANYLSVIAWAICYAEDFPGNPFYHDPAVRDAILRLGDFNCASVDDHGAFTTGFPGWDEWRLFTWMEAARLLGAEVDAARREAWTAKFVGAGAHVMDLCVDMDTFDGNIPNHGIWGHVFLYRVGQLFDVPAYREMAALALARVCAGQTADGCFREFQNAALLPGSPVTGYNRVSADAIGMYLGFTGDPAAAAALEKAWGWYYDFLLPDYSMPPTLDARMCYHAGQMQVCFPGAWTHKPEGAFLATRLFAEMQAAMGDAYDPHLHRTTAFYALQYDKVADEVAERAPAWPEYRRMTSEEACIRRRNGWAAVLSGITNRYNVNSSLWRWAHERQDCLSLAHEALGLLIGSAHSLADETFSTFVSYEDGAAYYLPNYAYLKSTPPLDTLLLRYGSNVLALSVDTTRSELAEIIFSLHGERGHYDKRGIGHPINMMAAKSHLPLRLRDGQTVRVGENHVTLDAATPLHLTVPAGAVADFGTWSLTSPDSPWELRWPCHTRDPYNPLANGERLAIAEAFLYPALVAGTPHPTATFVVGVGA